MKRLYLNHWVLIPALEPKIQCRDPKNFLVPHSSALLGCRLTDLVVPPQEATDAVGRGHRTKRPSVSAVAATAAALDAADEAAANRIGRRASAGMTTSANGTAKSTAGHRSVRIFFIGDRVRCRFAELKLSQ